MLRALVILFGILALALAPVVALSGGTLAAAAWLVFTGSLIVVSVVAERVHYKPLLTRSPGPGWTDSGECFLDPETQRWVKVYHHPATGERQYVETGDRD